MKNFEKRRNIVNGAIEVGTYTAEYAMCFCGGYVLGEVLGNALPPTVSLPLKVMRKVGEAAGCLVIGQGMHESFENVRESMHEAANEYYDIKIRNQNDINTEVNKDAIDVEVTVEKKVEA